MKDRGSLRKSEIGAFESRDKGADVLKFHSKSGLEF